MFLPTYYNSVYMPFEVFVHLIPEGRSRERANVISTLMPYPNHILFHLPGEPTSK